jgi:hypothetical protein
VRWPITVDEAPSEQVNRRPRLEQRLGSFVTRGTAAEPVVANSIEYKLVIRDNPCAGITAVDRLGLTQFSQHVVWVPAMLMIEQVTTRALAQSWVVSVWSPGSHVSQW